jgi:hypothetical protein
VYLASLSSNRHILGGYALRAKALQQPTPLLDLTLIAIRANPGQIHHGSCPHRFPFRRSPEKVTP